MLENKLETEIFLKNKGFVAHFDIKFKAEFKRKVFPSLLEKCIKNLLNANPRTILTKSKITFTIEISRGAESIAMSSLDKLNGIAVETTVNQSADISERLT